MHPAGAQDIAGHIANRGVRVRPLPGVPVRGGSRERLPPTAPRITEPGLRRSPETSGTGGLYNPDGMKGPH